MSIDVPQVYAVIALLDDVRPLAEALYKETLLGPKSVEKFAVGTEDFHLARIDDPDQPMIEEDGQGNSTMYLAWGHPHNPLDEDYMVVMICPLSRDSRGQWMYKPEIMLRGELADVVVVGGMSCCGSSLQTHWSEAFDDREEPLIDESRAPVTGIPNSEHLNWLKGKVRMAGRDFEPQLLADIAEAILTHRKVKGFERHNLADRRADISGVIARGPGCV